jgi:hypothetical protein
MFKNLITSLVGFTLVACSPAPQHHQLDKPYATNQVVEYHSNTNDMLWYYVLLTHTYGTHNSVVTNTYYYTSPTRLGSSNYSTIPFKSASDMSIAESEATLKGIEPLEPTNVQNIAVEEMPTEVQAMEASEVAQAYTEYEQEQNAIDSANNTQETSAEPTSSESAATETSSDSGSSSDSGGSSSSE